MKRELLAAAAAAGSLLSLSATASAQAPPPCDPAAPPAVVFSGLPQRLAPARDEAFGFEDNGSTDAEVPGRIAVTMTDRHGKAFFRGSARPGERGNDLFLVALDRGDRSVSVAASYAEVGLNGNECTRVVTRTVREGPGMRLVIRATRHGVKALGPFRIASPTLGAAIRAFGEPASTRLHIGCRVSWPLIGLVVVFENFGGGGNACDPRYGRAQTAAIRGRRGRMWRTRAGLRIGQSEHQIRRRHHSAVRPTRRTWWLVTGRSPFGPTCGGKGCPFGIVAVRAKRHRVQSFLLQIGAAGD